VVASNAVDFTLSDDTLDRSGLQHVFLFGINDAKLTGGAGNHTFTLTHWTGTATLDANGGNYLLKVTTNGNATTFTLADASLTRSDGGTVTLRNIHRADLVGGTGNDTFIVSGWTGTATLEGHGGTDTVVSTNDANFTLSDTTLTRSTGGTFTLQQITQARLTGGASANTFDVSGWTGTATLDGQGGGDTVISSNDADFTVTATTLTRSTNGTFTLANIATVQLTGGRGNNTFLFNGWNGGAVLDGGGGTDTVSLSAGTVSVTRMAGVAVLNITGGTLNLVNGASVQTLNQTGGTLQGAGTLTITGGASGASTWGGGTMSGSGTTAVAGGATLNLSGGGGQTLDGRTLSNGGTVTWTGAGGITAQNGAVVQNGVLAVFDARGDGTFAYGGGAMPGITNYGIFRKSSGTGTTTIDIPFTNLTNTSGVPGDLQAQSGKVSLTRGGTNSAAFDVSQGATLDFSTVAYTLAGSLNGAGTATVTGVLNWTAGGMTGTGVTVVNAGGVLNIRTAGSGPGGMLPNKVLDGRSLVNNGTVNWSASGTFNPGVTGTGGCVFTNAGTFNAQVASSFFYRDSTVTGAFPTFLNQGTLKVLAAGTTSPIYGGGTFINAGAVQLQQGTLALGSGSATQGDTGTYAVAAGTTLQLGGARTLAPGYQISGAGSVVFMLLSTTTVTGSSGGFTGTMQLLGTLTLAMGGLGVGSLLQVTATGVLSGNGTVAGTVVNSGVVAPTGTSTAAPRGTLTIQGNYTQNPGAYLLVTITPNGSDSLNVTGQASLSGLLHVTEVGYPPPPVDPGLVFSVRVLTAGSRVGTFQSVGGETIWPLRAYYDGTGVTVADT
jgi:hypothetical protein